MIEMEATEDKSTLQEEIRVRRRAKNKAKKEELKRVREEEKRRKLFQPKDQRVRVVPYKEVEIFQRSRGLGSDDNCTHLVPSLSEEFPSLGSKKSRLKSDRKVRGQSEGQQHKQKAPTSDGLVFSVHQEEDGQEMANVGGQAQGGSSTVDRNTNQTTSSPETSESLEQQAAKHTAKIQCAKPKRADPIHVDLLAVLKQNKSSNAANKRSGPPTVGKKKAVPNLSGNQLDSSNPERKKGKKREILKPSKPTRLKSVILQDRLIRASNRSILNNDENTLVCVSNKGGAWVPNEQLVSLREEAGGTETVDRTVTADSQPVEIQVAPGTTEFKEEVIVPIIEKSFSCCVITSDNEILTSPISSGENNLGLLQNSILLHEESNSENIVLSSQTIPTRSVHSRKFRGYCDHMLSPILDNAVRALVQDIVKFQDRQYFSDPIKAHAKRRFVLGFRETQKYLKLKKVKLIIIAPDLESAQSEGGIDDTVMELKTGSKSQDVPYVFALGRKDLRKLTNKGFHVRGISCVGVINYEGSQDNFLAIQEILPELRSRYEHLTGHQTTPAPVPEVESVAVEPQVVSDINSQVVASFLVKLTKELEEA